MKAVLKYPGAKWALSDWIISHFPEHKVYLEPYCGSAAVFFNKKPSQLETLNDLDGRIYNFFKVCRENPEELARLVYYTPYSRKEYDLVSEDHAGEEIKLTDNSIENARSFLIRCNLGFGNKLADRVGWKNTISSNGPVNPRIWNMVPGTIFEATERLKQAQIENSPAVKLIERYNTEDCLIYADPPYLEETRHGRIYSCEMRKAEDHKEMLEALLKHKGTVVLSGYDNSLYNERLKDWHKAEKKEKTQSGQIKTEILWMNFEPDRQMNLFGGE